MSITYEVAGDQLKEIITHDKSELLKRKVEVEDHITVLNERLTPFQAELADIEAKLAQFK